MMVGSPMWHETEKETIEEEKAFLKEENDI